MPGGFESDGDPYVGPGLFASDNQLKAEPPVPGKDQRGEPKSAGIELEVDVEDEPERIIWR